VAEPYAPDQQLIALIRAVRRALGDANSLERTVVAAIVDGDLPPIEFDDDGRRDLFAAGEAASNERARAIAEVNRSLMEIESAVRP
jgi:hypothetical protein